MGMPLSALAQIMTTEEFEAHRASFRLNPWGPYRDNLHAAIVAREVANMAGRTLNDGAERALDDYLLKPDAPVSDQALDDDNEIDNFQD